MDGDNSWSCNEEKLGNGAAGNGELDPDELAAAKNPPVLRQGQPDEVATIVFPIPLRPGVIVRVAGIPSDLSPDEAEKIGSVVLALSALKKLDGQKSLGDAPSPICGDGHGSGSKPPT